MSYVHAMKCKPLNHSFSVHVIIHFCATAIDRSLQGTSNRIALLPGRKESDSSHFFTERLRVSNMAPMLIMMLMFHFVNLSIFDMNDLGTWQKHKYESNVLSLTFARAAGRELLILYRFYNN